MMISMEGVDEKFVNAVASAVAEMMLPKLETMVQEYHEPDQGLNQQGAADVLGCSTQTLMDYYFVQPGFPHFKKGTHVAFSKKAVEKWMADNQIYA